MRRKHLQLQVHDGQHIRTVHGAWHGAWCWAAVIRQLELLGDRACAIDLPGHGQDRTARATIKFEDYVRALCEFIEDRNLTDVVLVGHSLGGITIAGATGRIPRRIKRTVFATAFVMLDGEHVADPSDPAQKPLADAIASRADRSITLDMMGPQFYAGLMNDVPAEMRGWIGAALCPEPGGRVTEALPMRSFHESGVPTGYLACENDQTPVAGAPNWHPHFSSRLRSPAIRSINCGHELMFTHPEECARALHELAEAR